MESFHIACHTRGYTPIRTAPGRALLLFCGLLASLLRVAAADSWVHEHDCGGDFPLVWDGNTADIVIAPNDSRVVAIAAHDFASDVERVTGNKPRIAFVPSASSENIVLIGTLGRSPTIDALVAAGKIDVGAVRGEWETFLIATMDVPRGLIAQPLQAPAAFTATGEGDHDSKNRAAITDNVRALVIVGSDRRGTAFGVYELSQAIGISPWHWWADVRPERKNELYVAAGTRRFGPPSVRYRGIFINDEDWGLQPWAAKTFAPEDGGVGPKTYAKVFELLLRLKANTLWPAMHKCTRPFNSFTENAALADDYGIVMGSSHAEPMLRNNVGEWTAPPEEYNFVTNRAGVMQYWEERVIANGRHENLYTVGMRGIHDSNMLGPKTDAERIATLEQIFAAQRGLLATHVNASVERVPQMFCAYKEVLDLYRQGLRVPDDVTIVWPDDNFGYVRNFATAKERKRTGGFGVYYHLSYLGRPLSYLWLCTTPPALIWEEMSKAYDRGAQQIWIANVGDLKPAEITTEFFLQMAWDISRWPRGEAIDFLRTWAEREFGVQHAMEIAGIMNDYYRLNFQRKPEHLQWWKPGTSPWPSPFTAGESRERLTAFTRLVERVARVETLLAGEKRDAFFELVSYPVRGSALANERYFAGEQSALAGGDAALAEQAHAADRQLREETLRFNEEIVGGKWNGIMTLEPADNDWKSMRIASWTIPTFAEPSAAGGAAVSAAGGPHDGELHRAKYDAAGLSEGFVGFVEKDGVVSIDAVHGAVRGAGVDPAGSGIPALPIALGRTVDARKAMWECIPGLGRQSDVMAVFPTTMASVDIEHATNDAPRLEYSIAFTSTGTFPVQLYLLPTHPIDGRGELRLAIALDDGPPQLVRLAVDDDGSGWADGVLNAVRVASTTLHVATPGVHRLRIFGTDPGVMLEKVVVDCGGLTPSYFGPTETVTPAAELTTKETKHTK